MNIEQGRGSLHLLKTACSFIKAKYGHSKIEFIEKSYVMCSKNWRMPLCYYYLVKHGKTWYEEKLGAHPESIKAQQRYRDEKQKLMASLTSLDKPSFKTFASDYNISKKLSEDLKDIYDSSKTLKGFFKIIFDEYDCGMLKGWFVDFVSDYTRTYGSSWIFDIPSDDTTRRVYGDDFSRLARELRESGRGYQCGKPKNNDWSDKPIYYWFICYTSWGRNDIDMTDMSPPVITNNCGGLCSNLVVFISISVLH
jgi:hypothetical protein